MSNRSEPISMRLLALVAVCAGCGPSAAHDTRPESVVAASATDRPLTPHHVQEAARTRRYEVDLDGKTGLPARLAGAGPWLLAVFEEPSGTLTLATPSGVQIHGVSIANDDGPVSAYSLEEQGAEKGRLDVDGTLSEEGSLRLTWRESPGAPPVVWPARYRHCPTCGADKGAEAGR